MRSLHGHKVLLGISGGIAAYKSAVLARRLIDAGAEVRVVMTAGAQAFVTPLTLQALTGEAVHTDLLDPAAEAAMGHIELARWADSVLIAPASANTLARLANGFADDLLSTLCLATDAPLHLAPAMNRLMWTHPATRDNVARLAARGVTVFGPAEGVQACGETGSGRMLEPEELRDALAARVAERGALIEPPTDGESASAGATASARHRAREAAAGVARTDLRGADVPTVTNGATAHGGAATENGAANTPREAGTLRGLSFLLTAGPTREAIDPVRYVSNRSSGRMGYALAAAAAARGAEVTLVSGPVDLDTPPGVTRVDVVSARDMRAAVLARLGDGADGTANGVMNGSVDGPANGSATAPAGTPVDVFVAVAAVSDYRVADVAAQKIKKRDDGMTLELIRNPDILAEVAALPPDRRPFCVGFAAETERVEEHARGKLERKGLDMIAANHVAQPGREVFGSATNALDVYWASDGHARIDTADKARVAEALLALVAGRLAGKRSAAAGRAPSEAPARQTAGDGAS